MTPVPSLGLDDMAIFVAVADSGSFTSAAKQLGVQKGTVSRRIRELEASLDAQLLVRSTRAVRLTDDGKTYLEHARRAVEAARMAARSLAEGRGAPSGTLRISTTVHFGEQPLAPVLVEYMRRYPDVSVELELTAQRVSLIDAGFDVALRFGSLADSTLLTRRIAVGAVGCFASPEYLARRGTPSAPEELATHDLLVSDGLVSTMWPFRSGGRKVTIPVRPRLSSASHRLAALAAEHGLGIAYLPFPAARDASERGALVQILAPFTPPPFPLAAVMPRQDPLPVRIRAFVDLLVESAAKGLFSSLAAPLLVDPRREGEQWVDP